jgi:hypothetical protein
VPAATSRRLGGRQHGEIDDLTGKGVASQLLVIGYLGGLEERGREIKNQTAFILMPVAAGYGEQEYQTDILKCKKKAKGEE